MALVKSSVEDELTTIFQNMKMEDTEEKYEIPNSIGVSLLEGKTLFKHQIECIKWMKLKEKSGRYGICGGILALSMGLGKTLTSTSLCMSEKTEYPNLIVCSKTVAYEWKNDIIKFFGKSCPFLIFHKSYLRNFDLLTYETIKSFKVIITTYETVMNVAKKNKVYEDTLVLDTRNRKTGIKNIEKPSIQNLQKVTGGMLLFKVPWNRIIADESHRFSNPKSITYYSMMSLYGDKKWCLSGTPLRNYTTDMYSQLRFCGYNNTVIPRQFKYSTYRDEKLAEFIMYKDYKDVNIKLPQFLETQITLEFEGQEKQIYDYYLSATRKAYNGFLVGSVQFACVLVLFLRLRQICVSPYTILKESSRNYKGEDKTEYSISQEVLDQMTDGLASWIKDVSGTAGIHSIKMNMIMKILSNIKKGEKILIFTSFKKVIDVLCLAIKEKLPNMKYLTLDGDVVGEERNKTLDLFKNKDEEYDVMLISYKVGSEGLNLVEANNVIMCENWWCPVVQQQAQARVYRMGQNKNVNVWKLIVKNSIEERIEEICKNKINLINQFVQHKKPTKMNAQMLGHILSM